MNTTSQRPPKPVSAYRAAPRTFVSSAPTCPRCDKSVYAAEQVLGPGGREYHKPCLTCVSCKKTVAPGTFEEHEGDPYCKHCYSKNFGPKGYGHGGAMTGEYHDPLLSSSRSPFSSPARTSSRTSLSYTSNPLLDSPSRTSTTTRDSFDSSKRDSFTSSRDSPVAGSSSRTAIESPMSKYRNSRLQDLEDDDAGEGDSDYTKTVKKINGLQLARAPAFDDVDDEDTSARSASPTKRPPSPLKCPVSPIKPPVSPTKPLPVRSESPASSVGTSTSSSGANPASGVGYKSNLGILGNSGPDQCRRCGTTVYFAEKVVAGGHKWHKRCLRCAKCSKALDSHLLEKDNLPYCKKCYDEQYGIRSQGFVLRPGLH